MNSENSKTSDSHGLFAQFFRLNEIKEKWKVCCFIKS